MYRNSTPLLAVLAFAACNLPTDANSARDRLADRTETAGALTVPFPLLQFESGDYLARGDAKLDALLDPSAQSLAYPTEWRDVNVATALNAFTQSFPVQASDFGPEFAALLDLVRLHDSSVQLEVENTGDRAVTLQGVNVALIDAAGRVVQRAAPAGTVAPVIAAKSKGTIDIPVAELANLLLGDIAHGRDVQISFNADRLSVQGGGTVTLRTRATVRTPLVIELGSREVQFRRVLHTKLDGDDDLLRQLGSLTVDSAWIDIDVNNALPIALRAAIIIAPTPADTTGFDPATSPDRIILKTIEIAPARAKADGTVTARGITHMTLPLSASTIDLLRSGSLSLAGDFTISAAAERVKISHNSAFEVKASGRLRVKHKGR